MSSRNTLVVAAALAPMVLVGCIKNDDNGSVGEKQQRMVSVSRSPVDEPITVAKLPDKYLTLVGGERILPAYKTEWERKIERAVKGGNKGVSLANADQYDDYRAQNFDKYAITKAPTTTGFRAPAEYEPSQAYILHWAQYTQQAWNDMFGEIVKGAWGKVPVLMIYNNAAHKLWLEGQLTSLGYTATDWQNPQNIIWYKDDSDAIWARDYGPISIVDQPTTGTAKLSFIDFRYYHTRVYDDKIPSDLAADWGINVFRPDLDMEPGNFMNTDDGLCAMTKGTLWANPQYSQSAIEDIFKDYVGCQAFLWPAPLAGGVIPHIDMYSKFGPNYAVMVGEYTTTQDATNKAILDAVAQLYTSTTTPTGQSFTVTRIPMPDKGGTSGNYIWRTYTNSVSLSNGTDKVVLIPVYAQETSQETAALAAYTAVFPGWTQVKITSDVIIPGQGATHCITMQIPVGDKAKMEADPGDLCGQTKYQCNVAICGNIPAEGCCEGDVLKFCDGGKLSVMDCANSPSCGWDSTNSWYDCSTSGTADPSNTFTMNCGVLTDAPLPDTGPDTMPVGCGNVSYEGCCDGNTVWYCDNGSLKNINCSQNPSCGWSSSGSYYDCGTSGTADPSGTYPMPCGPMVGDAGLPPTDGQTTTTPDQGTTTGCGNVSYEGCCDGETLKYCDSGKLETIDCTQNPSCGWSSTGGYYDCGTSGSADPAGTHPKACGGTTTPDGGTTTADMFTADTAPVTPDQAVTSPDQAVTTPDQGSSMLDTGASSTDSGSTDGDDGDDGCSCNVAAGSGSEGPFGMLSLVLLGVVALVRRRRR